MLFSKEKKGKYILLSYFSANKYSTTCYIEILPKYVKVKTMNLPVFLKNFLFVMSKDHNVDVYNKKLFLLIYAKSFT